MEIMKKLNNREKPGEILQSVAGMLYDLTNPIGFNCDVDGNVVLAAIWGRLEDLAKAMGEDNVTEIIRKRHAGFDAWFDLGYGVARKEATSETAANQRADFELHRSHPPVVGR